MTKIDAIEKALPELKKAYEHCELCVRKCGVNRLEGEKGYCSAYACPKIYNFMPHKGEEPPISGARGSGVILFTHCSMNCVYCQNYRFSQEGEGTEISCRELGGLMLKLRDEGCHNINLVSPTHFVPSIVEALDYAYKKGLDIPVVYNTGGYDSLWAIKALEGIVDIYLLDMRYSLGEMAEQYSNAPGYVENNRALALEMHRQAGRLEVSGGLAVKGLIVRLLALPENISGTVETLNFLASNMGKDVSLSVMSQYYPAYKAGQYKKLSQRVREDEYSLILKQMDELGMNEGWVQPSGVDFDEELAGENFPRCF